MELAQIRVIDGAFFAIMLARLITMPVADD
jgi:hypothetical protein